MIRKTLLAVPRALKSFAMRWSGQARHWWSALLPRTKFDYAKEVGDVSRSNIVAACIGWIARNFPEAPVIVVEENSDGTRGLVPNAPMSQKIERPNPYYSGVLMWMATIADWVADGNGYWLKIRSGARKVVQLWWAPSWTMEPRWPDDGQTFISHYDYRPDPARDPIKVPPTDVVHFRNGMDPENTRKGLSQLRSLMREIFTDEEAANMTASLMRNLGIPGVVISPKQQGASLSKDSMDEMKDSFQAKFGGDKRGEPMIHSVPIDVSVLSFSPEQMLLRELRRIPEERAAAVIGVPAIVVGLGAGLERSTFTNMKEAKSSAWESAIIPAQRLMAADLEIQLLPDFDDRPNMDVDFDLTRVRALQPDLDKTFSRVGGAVRDGFAMVSDARRAVGLPVSPEHDVYLRAMNIVEVPAGSTPKADSVTARKAARAASADAKRQMAQAHRKLFEDAAARLVEKERKDIMALARRILSPKALKADGAKATSEFQIANDAYYEPYPQVVEEEMLPAVMAYGEVVQATAAAEVGSEPGITPEMTTFLAAYAAGIGTWWASSSRGQVRKVVTDALGEGRDPIGALEGRLDEWAEKRPGKTGAWETVGVSGAVSEETYREAGQPGIWTASANSCPLCAAMDGRLLSEAGKHPPLHGGCVCVVMPG